MELKEVELHGYDRKLMGGNLPSDTLSALLASEGMILFHFLRHLDCIYCKHSVDQLYKISREMPNFPIIYFVHTGDKAQGDEFFARHFPGARHIADPRQDLYRHFGIRRLGCFQFLNPRMIFKGFKLFFKGYRNVVRKSSDIRVLSGTFLFHNGQMVWAHRARYAGDEPSWERIIK